MKTLLAALCLVSVLGAGCSLRGAAQQHTYPASDSIPCGWCQSTISCPGLPVLDPCQPFTVCKTTLEDGCHEYGPNLLGGSGNLSDYAGPVGSIISKAPIAVAVP